MVVARELLFDNGICVVVERYPLSEGANCAVGVLKHTEEPFKFPFPNSAVLLPGVNISKISDVKKICISRFGASRNIVKKISYRHPYVESYLREIYGEEFFR